MAVILLNKPFRVLSQFTDDHDRDTLAGCIDADDVYPAGRLDFDSEGLLILTDDGPLQARISHRDSKLDKHYWAQVEGVAEKVQLDRLMQGVRLKEGRAAAVSAQAIGEPGGLWPRVPPIRYRKSVPTSWIDLSITEGRNRQVRRMTAAAGLPTLRLIRHRIGPWSLEGLGPGDSRAITSEAAWQALRDYA